MYQARFLSGDYFQDPGNTVELFTQHVLHTFVDPKHYPFASIYLIHPIEERSMDHHEFLHTDLVYFLFIDYRTVLPWVKEDRLDKDHVATLQEGIRWIDKYQPSAYSLSGNPSAGHLLWKFKDEPEQFNWNLLCTNPCVEAIAILEQYPERIQWDKVSANPGAIRLLQKRLDLVNWKSLCMNQSREAIDLLKKYPQNINWVTLCSNPIAMDLLTDPRHAHQINLHQLCLNPSPEAMDLIIERFDQLLPVDWAWLSSHPYVSKLIQVYPHVVSKIHKTTLASNPCLFDIVQQHPYNYSLLQLCSNPHPDLSCLLQEMYNSTIHVMVDMFRVLKHPISNALFSNPSALPFIMSHLRDWLREDEDKFWQKISFNKAIYCPPI